MSRIRWNISAGAVLSYALIYFFDGSGIVSAAVPAVLIHELGHILALRLCGHGISGISAGLFGLKIDYIGELGGAEALLCIGAGPLLGLMYSAAAYVVGGRYFTMSAGVSVVLSAFNLLPVLPLDGGRILAAVTKDRFSAWFSKIFALILLCAGTVLLLQYHSVSVFMIGVWLTLSNFRA